jgi:hypothetical protein
MAGDRMGRLELPMPELEKGSGSLEKAAKDMQDRIRSAAPPALRKSIVVKAYRGEKGTGIAIEYDDRAENLVYVALEYPRSGGKE